ncbi:hypothetical protein SeMB42_g00795 [Synchytrium endobioticum]|uniref:Fatty acid hydroxylase domain-containing protein n=1 Tax=Synchytrium endobioticum TaxID=286115 RepID=A0A507DP14_9FUNG|nr:hypothetical protein SeLEV6574_g00284 [Synchytrium endobioticum]TPX53412.1 hypothetical protein SeMB42_g00795 [Synchytrium endobioticum]
MTRRTSSLLLPNEYKFAPTVPVDYSESQAVQRAARNRRDAPEETNKYIIPYGIFLIVTIILSLFKLFSGPQTFTMYSAHPSEMCMIFVPVIAYWLYSGTFLLLENLRIPSLERYRIVTRKRTSNPPLAKVVIQVLSQHTLQALLAVVLAVILRPPAGQPQRNIEPIPLLIQKLVIGALILDTYQYWIHRLMHVNRFLYRTIHSVHHQLTSPYAVAALYNHPVEGLVMDTLGSGIASIVTDMHPWTSMIFFTLATLKTCDDHVGYALPYDPFQKWFANNAVYHDIHHYGKGRMYNFSQPFFINWDKWMGTDYYDAIKSGRLTTKDHADATPHDVGLYRGVDKDE